MHILFETYVARGFFHCLNLSNSRIEPEACKSLRSLTSKVLLRDTYIQGEFIRFQCSIERTVRNIEKVKTWTIFKNYALMFFLILYILKVRKNKKVKKKKLFNRFYHHLKRFSVHSIHFVISVIINLEIAHYLFI